MLVTTLRRGWQFWVYDDAAGRGDDGARRCRILTFNTDDFTRYGIEVIHPSAVS